MSDDIPVVPLKLCPKYSSACFSPCNARVACCYRVDRGLFPQQSQLFVRINDFLRRYSTPILKTDKHYGCVRRERRRERRSITIVFHSAMPFFSRESHVVCSAQVACGPCNAYSGHLYERLGEELGAADGMTMKSSFCEDLVTACVGFIDFPTYDGLSYCEKHVGDNGDLLWSYPIDESGAFHRLHRARFRPTSIRMYGTRI